MNMAERQKAQRERLAKALLASEAVQAIIGEPEYVIVRKVQRRFWHIEYAPESIVVVSRNVRFPPCVMGTFYQGKWMPFSERLRTAQKMLSKSGRSVEPDAP